jgi:MFS superfamily sulfate permease-like transporter
VPGTDDFADRVRHPENEVVPDVLVFRATGALLYFNVEHVRDRFFELLNDRAEKMTPGPRLVVFFMGAVPDVDLGGAELLLELHQTLHKRGVELRLAETLSSVRDTLGRAGFERECGPIVANQPVAAAIGDWQRRQAAAQ